MKILRVANGIYPETIGGVEVSVQRLSTMQADDGHEVTVLVPEPAFAECEEPDFDSVRHYDPIARVFGNPLSPYPYRYLKRNADRFDVVHGHSHLFSGSVFAARAANKFGLPYVVTSHGFQSQTAPPYVNVPYNETVGRYVFRSADRILTYTEREVAKLRDLGIDSEKIHHVQRGIDVDAVSPSFRRPRDPPRVLWVSRFAPGKGAHVLVDALDHLRQRGVDVEATLVGEGLERRDVEQTVEERGLGDRVTIKDFLPQEELYDEYRRATVFVLPSISEGMNRTVLESMAAGTPVVISDLPHFHDIVDGCGRIVEERDGRAFADAIEELLTEDLQALGTTARDRIEGRFTWTQTFDDIRPIFREVVAKREVAGRSRGSGTGPDPEDGDAP